jgi:putative redox protein
MAEMVAIRQSLSLETHFEVSFTGEEKDLKSVEQLHELTPYGMMLASLGSCTAMVINTFAQNNNYPLEMVNIQLKYERVFKEDCENCAGIDRYDESISDKIQFLGDLSEQQRSRLAQVAHLCPIFKIFKSGIEIHTEMHE